MGFQMRLVCPEDTGWGDMGNLITEVAPGDWAIDIVEVQIPTYAPMCPLLGGVGHNIDRRITTDRISKLLLIAYGRDEAQLQL